MTDHDERVSRRYGDLPRDEPPAALDAAILSHARRSVARPRSRWTGPVSIAAVLALALGITLRMQHEEPGIETAPPAASSPEPPARESAAPAAPPQSSQPIEESPARTPAPPSVEKRTQAESKRQAPAAKPAPSRATPQALKSESAVAAPSPGGEAGTSIAPAQDANVAEPPRPASPAPPASMAPAAPAPVMRAAPSAPAVSPTSGPASPAAAQSRARPSTQSAPAAAPMQKRSVEPPEAERETELERIAALREAGSDSEADAALAAFRERYPRYVIPDAMWIRVKPR